MFGWGCTLLQPGCGCGTQPHRNWDKPSHNDNKFPYLAFSKHFSSLPATALPRGPEAVMAAYSQLLYKALCHQKRQNSPRNAFCGEKKGALEEQNPWYAQVKNSILQGGTGTALRARTQGQFETCWREVCSGSAGRLPGHNSLPQVHCSTLCPLSELSFAQESWRESQWSLGACTYTHAHTPPKWQVQRVMKKGRRSALPHLLSFAVWENSWWPCISSELP